jgi:TusA-related sulfurtransferase
MKVKTIQEISRGDWIKIKFDLPSQTSNVNDFVEVTDKEFDHNSWLLALEYNGYLFEKDFGCNTAFLTK